MVDHQWVRSFGIPYTNPVSAPSSANAPRARAPRQVMWRWTM